MWPVLMPGPAPAYLPEGKVSRSLNSSGSPYHWLGFLGCHSKPKEEFSHLEGSKGPGQGTRGRRDDKS